MKDWMFSTKGEAVCLITGEMQSSMQGLEEFLSLLWLSERCQTTNAIIKVSWQQYQQRLLGFERGLLFLSPGVTADGRLINNEIGLGVTLHHAQSQEAKVTEEGSKEGVAFLMSR